MNLTAQQQLAMLRSMQTIRRFEERASDDFQAGHIYGIVHSKLMMFLLSLLGRRVCIVTNRHTDQATPLLACSFRSGRCFRPQWECERSRRSPRRSTQFERRRDKGKFIHFVFC